MRESKLLKKAADLGVTDELGVVPLAKVLPPRTTIGSTEGEGTQEQEENIEATEEIPAQPPSTDATNAPGTNAPTPPLVNISAGQPGVQGFTSTTQGMKVRNIKSDSDEEEEDLKKQWPLEGEQEGDEAKDLLNERLILTPQDQEDLLNDIAAGQGETELGDE